MSESDDREALFELLCTVSSSNYIIIFRSKLITKITLLRFLHLLFHRQSVPFLSCRLQTWKIPVKLFSWHHWFFHPGARLYLLNRRPFAQKYFLNQLLCILAERKWLVLWIDSLLKHRPKFVYILCPQVIKQRIHFRVFLIKRHVPNQHQNQYFATAKHQIFHQILAFFLLWYFWPPTNFHMSFRIEQNIWGCKVGVDDGIGLMIDGMLESGEDFLEDKADSIFLEFTVHGDVLIEWAMLGGFEDEHIMFW